MRMKYLFVPAFREEVVRWFPCVSLLFLLTSASAETTLLMPITQSWRYSTNNLDAVNWRAPGYAETGWSNLSPALLYIESTALPAPKNTPLPARSGGGPVLTYYFRTTFNVADAAPVVSLTFSNLIDDGAVFYLNGTEVQRVGMGSGSISYSSLATRSVGNATTFDVFSLAGDWLTNLVTGNNTLAVEVHQINATSSDIVFGSALLASTNASLTRGPYLQTGSSSALTVRWRTDAPVMGRVSYGTNLANLDFFVDETANTNEHELRLAGLLPDTKYFYSVGEGTTILAGANASHFFITAPQPGTAKPTRIWVIGDAGTANANQVNVRNAYETFTGSRYTDLWLMLGDNAYNAGTDGEYQAAVFNIYTNLLRTSVLWSTLGNHETGQLTEFTNNYPYFDIFTLPRNGEAGGLASGTEHYYAFNYGNIHFICLDSMTANRTASGAMYTWLTNDLADVTADWTIAFWHHPPYTKGSHNSDTESGLIQMRQVFLPVLEAGGVDLVLSGHSHSYERSVLLDGHYGLSTTLLNSMKLDAGDGREGGTGPYVKPSGGPIEHQGTVYAVVGSSGKTSGGTLNHPAMYVSLNNLGSLVLDINSNRLDAKFLRENGTTNDTFTLLKVNYAPVASNLTFNVPANTSTPLTLAGWDINRDAITFGLNQSAAHGLLTSLNPTNGAVSYLPAHGFTGGDSFTFRAHDAATNSPAALVSLNVLPAADTNANGLPDEWEALYGITTTWGDNDNDGSSNGQEYWANTNPTNALSTLRVLDAGWVSSSQFTLTWAAVGGTRYRVSYRDADPVGGFVPVVRPVDQEMNPAAIGVPAVQSFTDDFTLTGGAPVNGARYYRVEVVR